MAVFAAVAVVVVEIPAAAETAWQTDLAAEAVVVGIAAGQTAAAAVEAAGGERRQQVVFFWDQTGPGAWDQACYGPAVAAVGPQHYSVLG